MLLEQPRDLKTNGCHSHTPAQGSWYLFYLWVCVPRSPAGLCLARCETDEAGGSVSPRTLMSWLLCSPLLSSLWSLALQCMLIMPALCTLRQEDCSGFQAIQDTIVRQHLRKEGKEEGKREGGKRKPWKTQHPG